MSVFIEEPIMDKEQTNQKKMNVGEILRYIWWHTVKRIKFFAPLTSILASTGIYRKFCNHVLDKYDIYHIQDMTKQAQAYFEQNVDRVEKIKSKLSDEKSRLVYDNMIHYRCTRDSQYLEGIVDGNQYFDKSLIHFGTKEIYVDCGACGGDTVRICLKNLRDGLGKFKEIFALEPDPENYEKLNNWVSAVRGGDNDRIKCLNIGTWDKKGTLSFEAGLKGNSQIAESTKTQSFGYKDIVIMVNVDTLDNILGDKLVTFIKMDVEGSELPSLKGAEKVISANLPRLAICIYHSDADMVEIPDYLMEKYPAYHFYIRHYGNTYAETVLYAIPDKYL